MDLTFSFECLGTRHSSCSGCLCRCHPQKPVERVNKGIVQFEPKKTEWCYVCHEEIIGDRSQLHHIKYDKRTGGKTVKVHASCHINHHIQDKRMMTSRKRKVIGEWEKTMYKRKHG